MLILIIFKTLILGVFLGAFLYAISGKKTTLQATLPNSGNTPEVSSSIDSSKLAKPYSEVFGLIARFIRNLLIFICILLMPLLLIKIIF
jgi:hypothetical protein